MKLKRDELIIQDHGFYYTVGLKFAVGDKLYGEIVEIQDGLSVEQLRNALVHLCKVKNALMTDRGKEIVGEGRMKDNEIFATAIATFGEKEQKIVAMEECSELIQAISHELRGRNQNIPEEIADVEICLAQLKQIYSCASEVERIKREKVQRLYERICDKCF